MSGEAGLPKVTTATEFMAAVERGDAVEFEIEPGHVLRSTIPGPPDFLKKRLERMVEAERFGAQEGHNEADPDA